MKSGDIRLVSRMIKGFTGFGGLSPSVRGCHGWSRAVTGCHDRSRCHGMFKLTLAWNDVTLSRLFDDATADI